MCSSDWTDLLDGLKGAWVKTGPGPKDYEWNHEAPNWHGQDLLDFIRRNLNEENK